MPTNLTAAIAAILGFTTGFGWNAFGNSKEINLLHSTLTMLALCLYNIAIYIWLLSGKTIPRHNQHPAREKALQTLWIHLKPALPYSSIALPLGISAGLYWNGTIDTYRIVWDSLFLDEADVNALNLILLGIPALFTPLQIPDASTLQNAGKATTRNWVHLYTFAAILYLAIPRTLLILRSRKAWKITDIQCISILPFQKELPADIQSKIHKAFRKITGAPSSLQTPLAYGEAPQPTAPSSCTALIFPLAQTPEQEIHGKAAAECQPAVVVIDSSNWRQGESRKREREEAWSQVLQRADTEFMHCDLESESTAELTQKIQSSLKAARRSLS